MNWIYNPFTGMLFLTAILSACIAYLVSRHREITGATAIFLLLCAVAEWAFASGLEATAASLSQKVFWMEMGFLGSVIAPTFFLFFAMDYSRRFRWLTLRNMVLFSIVPLVAIIFTATNEWHGLIWSGITPSATVPNAIVYWHGPGYYALTFYNYVVVFAGLVLLVRLWRYSPRPHRIRVGLILLGSLFPIVIGILYLIGLDPVPNLDLTPVSLLLSGIVIAYGIFKYQIFDIVPIAHDILIESMTDGVLVVDNQDRIMDINLAAQEAIGISAKEAFRQPAASVLKEWGVLVTHFQDATETRTEICLRNDPPFYLDLQVSPLYGRQKSPWGRLIVFRDITQRKATEAALKQYAGEMGILNRINLAITSGLDLDHVLKTLHEQCLQIMASDVFYVALYDQTTGLIDLSLFYEGEYKNLPPRDLHTNSGLVGYVIDSRRTIYLPDVIDPNFPLPVTPIRLGGKPARSYIGIPLILREKVVGVMSVQSYNVDAYTEDQVHLLETIAVQAAIAIENARLYGEVQRMAIIDELTRVYNYRGLIELGAREVERARRFGHPLSLIFFDIDDFRNFNNRYSHATGNLVLQAVAGCCQSILRSVDIVGRYGGDEFVILLPETDLTTAQNVAKRLCEAIAATTVTTDYGELTVTISAGLADFTERTANIHALMDRANRAEHRAKKSGNCVEVELDLVKR